MLFMNFNVTPFYYILFQHCIYSPINLVDNEIYDFGFTVYCYYLVFTWVSVL